MRKITAIILALVLVLAGTAALADDIHDTLSMFVTYVDNVALSECVMGKIVDSTPPAGVYILCTSEGVAVEYYDNSTVRQYGYIPEDDTTVQSAAAAVAFALISADVLPASYVCTYINTDSGAVAMYNGAISDSDLIEGMYNDISEFTVFIMAN